MSAQYNLVSSVLLCIPFHIGGMESLSKLFKIPKHRVNGGAEIWTHATIQNITEKEENKGVYNFVSRGLDKEKMIIILVFVCLYVTKPYLRSDLFSSLQPFCRYRQHIAQLKVQCSGMLNDFSNVTCSVNAGYRITTSF